MATSASLTIQDEPDRRQAQPRSRAAAGTLVALLALAVMIIVITVTAQQLYRDELRGTGFPVYLYSLPKHLLAMLLLSGFTIGIATFAGLRRLGWLSVAVLVATAVGPMVVVAAPARSELLMDDLGVVSWWRTAVAVAVLAVLSAATWWNVRCLRTSVSAAPATPATPATTEQSAPEQADPLRPARSPAFSLLSSLAPGSVFSILTMAGLLGQILAAESPSSVKPGLLTMIAWAVLAATVGALSVQASEPRITSALLLGALVVQTALYLAYFRHGGWPGVAGWDAGTSPVILSPAATAMLLTAPLLGLIPTRQRVRTALASA